MSEVEFVTVDPEQVEQDLIVGYEQQTGETLYDGDERRIFLKQLIPVITGLMANINDTGRQNLLRYARGNKLDAIGEFYGTRGQRLGAQHAVATIRYTLSTAQPQDVIIPVGNRTTPDGVLFFATTEELVIPTGQTTGDILARATEAGPKHNGLTAGQINQIVDPVAFVASVSNTTTSSGGSDIESDDDYRARLQLLPESFSTAGPDGAYKFWAKTADENISDVSVTSPNPGEVLLTVLMEGGQLPTQDTLDAVEATCSADDRRPLTDNVSAQAPTVQNYNITMTYYISKDRETEETTIRDAIENVTTGAVKKYRDWQKAALGRAINPDYLRQLVLNAGACRLTVTAPVYTVLTADKVAADQVVTITYGGLE